MVILLLAYGAGCSSEPELTEGDYKKRKDRYLEIISQFEEQESIQACLALSNKLDQRDHLAAVETLKQEMQVSSDEGLVALNRKLVSMMIANCYTALLSISSFARDNVMSMVQESKADLGEIRGLFKMDRAMEYIQLGKSIDSLDLIGEMIELIDANKRQRSGTADKTYERAKENLDAKMGLMKEMREFESQQGMLLYGLVAVLGLWFVGLVYCVRLQRKQREEPDEEGVTKESKMKQLDEELLRLDGDIEKAQELIRKLKAKQVKS